MVTGVGGSYNQPTDPAETAPMVIAAHAAIAPTATGSAGRSRRFIPKCLFFLRRRDRKLYRPPIGLGETRTPKVFGINIATPLSRYLSDSKEKKFLCPANLSLIRPRESSIQPKGSSAMQNPPNGTRGCKGWENRGRTPIIERRERGWAEEVRLKAPGGVRSPKGPLCRKLDGDDAARLMLVAWRVMQGGNGGRRFRCSPLPRG